MAGPEFERHPGLHRAGAPLLPEVHRTRTLNLSSYLMPEFANVSNQFLVKKLVAKGGEYRGGDVHPAISTVLKPIFLGGGLCSCLCAIFQKCSFSASFADFFLPSCVVVLPGEAK